MITDDADREQVLRDKAVRQLKKQRDFRSHVLVYVLVNTLLVVIWVMTDPHGFFWPVFPIAGWGIGVIMNAWDVYGRQAGSRPCRRTRSLRCTAGSIPARGERQQCGRHRGHGDRPAGTGVGVNTWRTSALGTRDVSGLAGSGRLEDQARPCSCP